MRRPHSAALVVAMMLTCGDGFSTQDRMLVDIKSVSDSISKAISQLPSSTERGPLGQIVLASSFGSVCDGGASSRDDRATNTKAFVAALAAAAKRPATVQLPAGICGFDPFTIPPGVKVMGAGQGRTTLKAPASMTGSYVTVSSNSALQDLTIDGNKNAQTVGVCGVLGSQIRDAVIQDVTITNVLGMGDCFQDSAHIVHLRETVAHTQRPSGLTHTQPNGKNGSGFWTASYTQSSFFYDGGSLYIDCVATDNDLDGLEIGSNNTIVIGGHFDHNGAFTDITAEDRKRGTHTKILDGALGAAGIYFASGSGKPGGSPSTASNTVIAGVHAYANTESGFDLGLGQGSMVVGSIAYDNGTLGFLINGYAGTGSYSLIGNQAFDNGRTTFEEWLRANPAYMMGAGFAFTGIQSSVDATGNIALDHQGAAGTQKWGFYAEIGITAFGTPSFDRFVLSGNQLEHNALGGSNFDELSAAMPSQVTNLIVTP